MPHPQGHAHAVDLVRQIADMNRGKFIDGEVEECHHSKFSIGVAGYPEVHAEARDITSDIARLRDKVDAGAEYVITQMFFDNAKYFDFVRRCREAGITVPIIPGIKPLSTLRHLEILPETFGVKLPEELVREVKAHPDGVREVGTEWAIAQSRELMAAGVPVLHYYTMSRTTNIQKIVKAVFTNPKENQWNLSGSAAACMRFENCRSREHDTAAFIEQQLDELGIEHRRIASTGVVARIKGRKTPEGDRRAAVLRADIDALPVTERNDCEWRSQNEGVMHACGHARRRGAVRRAENLRRGARFPGHALRAVPAGRGVQPGRSLAGAGRKAVRGLRRAGRRP